MHGCYLALRSRWGAAKWNKVLSNRGFEKNRYSPDGCPRSGQGFTGIQSYRTSVANDKPTSRSEFGLLAKPLRWFGLDAHFECLVSTPGSSRGFRAGECLMTFMLLHEGERHLSERSRC